MRLSLLLALLAAPAALAQGAVTVHSGTTFVGEGATLSTSVDLRVETGATLDAAAGGVAFVGSNVQHFQIGPNDGEPFYVRDFTIRKWFIPPTATRTASARGGGDGSWLSVFPELHITGTLGLLGGTLSLEDDPATLEAVTSGSEVVSLAAIAGFGNVTFAGHPLVYERPHLDGAGWRMIAAPFASTFQSLNDDFHTQGAIGADYDFGEPNVRRWDPTRPAGQRFVGVTDFTEPMAPGRGYFLYAYATDPDGAPILPTVWDVEGLETTDEVQVPLSFDPSDEERRWNLLGNPYAAPLDWHAVQEAGRFQAAYAVWDPAANGGLGNYAYYSTTGETTGRAGRYIPALQGFWAEATLSSPFGLTYDREWRAIGADPVYAGRGRGEIARLRLRLAGEGLEATGPVALFLDGGATGLDPFDAAWLRPLSADYAAVFFLRDGAPLVFDGRPVAADGQTLGLGVEVTRAGSYTLSWPDLEAAPEGPITLTDLHTGATVDLRSADSYTFDVAANAAPTAPGVPPPSTRGAAEARFTLAFGLATAAMPEALPAVLAMEPPAPNPAVASVRLRYALPEGTRVRMTVVDVLGREVAVLAEGEKAAGHHTARLDAHALAAGLYVVRLETPDAVLTRRLTVTR